MNELDKAIEMYHDGVSTAVECLQLAIFKELGDVALKNPSLLNLIDHADEILAKLETEAIAEMNSMNSIIYHCLYNHIFFRWVKRRFNGEMVERYFHHLISIRQVTSYAEHHPNRYKIRENEYNTLHHNYYVIENKINDRLQLQYSAKIFNRISNSIMVVMYYLKVISKYNCNLKYDLIQSTVKNFGTKELY